ncbi:MAG: 50S ribosomal protein L21e [Halobacteria archaeon]
MAYRRKTRSKLRLGSRERCTVTRSVQEFRPGESVHIRIDPSFHKGLPHPRFEGRTGKVLGQQGRAFLVEVRDGRKLKTLLTRPEHLSPAPGGPRP